MRSVTELSLLPATSRLEDPGTAKRSSAFCTKLAFMSFLFRELHCSASGARLAMDAPLILCGLSLPLTQSKSLPLSFKSPNSLCLPPSSCPLLFIAPRDSLFRFTILCLCGALSISLSPLSVTDSPSHSVYLSARRLHQCIHRRLCIVTLQCLPLCLLSAISKINYTLNKTIPKSSSFWA